ncbi:hypothetical protein BM1_02459 [Bipolaris maydis]|nr:hypothetical protein BM1_02459 [Bipolaris maydis]
MPSHVISPRDDHPSRQDPKWFPNFLSSYPGSESFCLLLVTLGTIDYTNKTVLRCRNKGIIHIPRNELLGKIKVKGPDQ